MQCRVLTPAIYCSAAAACSAWLLSRYNEELSAGKFFITWLVIIASPLLLAYTIPIWLYGEGSSQNRRSSKWIAVHGFIFLLGTVIVSRLATPFWENPVRDLDSFAIEVGMDLSAALFVITSILLLVRRKAGVAVIAAILLWPYWFFVEMESIDRFFQDSKLHAAFFFLCFSSSLFMALGAGVLNYRPKLAHALVIAAVILAAPWLYWTATTRAALDNPWIYFNIPDDAHREYSPLYPKLNILAVAFLATAIGMAVLRLASPSWVLRGKAVRERTWPVVVFSILLLAFWFSRSVMPYRIPGAVDYVGGTDLQILHVEKNGLQFHETVIGFGRDGQFGTSRTDRRLLEYSFREQHRYGVIPEALRSEAHTIVAQFRRSGRHRVVVRPIRKWNADQWYVTGDGVGMWVYGTDVSAPPPEVVNVFQAMVAAPTTPLPASTMRDVCLGFCYDPLSALGMLYTNHRCFDDGTRVRCQ